ncbi:phospholipid-translocating P-type ATPase, flippase family protein [Tritrichomonas foetus]|uniref:Phospholipid-transporting ATPase n=1 Tax=Tritrichomonas foetus TaxID=1144522 RepID=A0A1J4JS04_9EUKA|nr:phospholipid-translocating P-type ATPase, flippase family protein [Tritrichomonas foetus]|eukprot:OHT00021.1 phospholipid-translocating P-type ATPase, flippase family protein [Tritrichomonas foetus]
MKKIENTIKNVLFTKSQESEQFNSSMSARISAAEQSNAWAVVHFLYPSNEWPGQKDNFISTTRYNAWTFLPLTLFENFRCMTNIYFLIVLIISCLPSSPVSFVLNLIPLVFVLAVSMVKSGIEDMLKRKQDKIRNQTPVKIYKYGEWVTVQSKDIHAGDLVMQEGTCMVACDMLFITSSNENQTVNYSETQLNGESAVKTLSPHPAFKEQQFPAFLIRNQFEVHLPEPTRDLFKFDAKMVGPNNSKYPVAIHNILLRGMTIQYTDWFMGIALCTGHDCKIMKNQGHPPAKVTQFDKDINWMIIGIFIFKMSLILILAGVCAHQENNKFPYLKLVISSIGSSMWTAWMQYFVLYSYFIPISLMVTVEIIRLFHMIILMFDKGMVDELFGWPEPHNANSIGQLGLITHVLSDKTGTLTENLMELVQFVDKNGLKEASTFANQPKEEIDASFDFLQCLAICNTVIVYHSPDGKTEYNAESPDESAFVSFAAKCGVVLIDRQPDSMVIEMKGEQVKYDIISLLPFDSDRKRMTIAVKEEGKEEVIIFTKGADNIIYERSVQPMYQDEVNVFALAGLRTLVFSKRVLSKKEGDEWIQEFNEANSSIENRDEAIAAIAPHIESQLECVGVSAIEDRLQPHVREAIRWLRAAGISLWVLTGDKLETAIEIGKTSAVILPDSDMLIVSNEDDNEIEKQIKHYSEQFDGFHDPVLILTAHATELVLTKLTDIFMPVALKCKSVIFSRVSPFQKASIVAAVKRQKGTMTLAIGDGANDVGMIQEAHVGIGVQGREGSQAAQNSDFAIPRFQHLIRLIAVHGHWTVSRFMKTAMFMLYKNFTFIMTYFWSSFDTMFSPTDFYDQFFISMFNLVFTLLPPFAYGFFERDMKEGALLKYPQLHRSVPNPMRLPHLIIYFAYAIYQSVVVYYSVRLACKDDFLQSNGNLAYLIVVMIVAIQMALWANDWNGFVIAALILTFVLLFVVVIGYSYIAVPSLVGVIEEILGSVRGWCTIAITLVLSIIPPATISFIMSQFKPTLSRLIMERECEDKNDPLDFVEAMKLNPCFAGEFTKNKDASEVSEISSDEIEDNSQSRSKTKSKTKSRSKMSSKKKDPVENGGEKDEKELEDIKS